MLLSLTAVLATCFMAGPASAGSRLWEAPIYQIRGNATIHEKRAVSVVPGSGAADTRLWPDKTITYGFADTTAKNKLKAMFVSGSNVWNGLSAHGFKYKEVSEKNCKSDRMNCLLVHYNANGLLSSTVAKPPKVASDTDYEGPTMHLSDSFAVGNRNPILNIAHEIGHAWGLYHEHQNEGRWKTSPEHGGGQTTWGGYTGNTFHTNRFVCRNLKDYTKKLAEVQSQPNAEINAELMCTSFPTAARLKFSAMEWLPVNLVGKKADHDFDPDSLMLYPSRAGGIGDASENSDSRLPVLTYADGSEIPIRQGPSNMDIARLVELYGTTSRGASEPYNKKGSKLENLFRKVRAGSSRAGDTKGGLC
ncbi:hypothetical protein QQS21_007637 [Conoideocrella luteorostrata]|uniref:Uncharacterized protein n=1 Tax=Conoideocrella luteorostrata TaxID=1105319 RepID=A0AAJ0CKC5_9HYPO|nr:hypothetical protein QQS21_007637 [Conoideocrella luteorostrata]